MLDALVEAAKRFRADGVPRTGYKPRRPHWIVDLTGGDAQRQGPFQRSDTKPFFTPDRQRSGTPSKKAAETEVGANSKPFLINDEARYVFGKEEPDAPGRAAIRHREYLRLLECASAETGLPEVAAIAAFLKSPKAAALSEPMRPRDFVVFMVDGKDPVACEPVHRFWLEQLGSELAAEHAAFCGGCGRHGPVLRTLPREIVVFHQKCQVFSFNHRTFESHEWRQTENAPVCFECANAAIDALDHLLRTDRHRTRLLEVHNRSTDQIDPFRSQLGVFWLRERPKVLEEKGGLDFEEILKTSLLSEAGAHEATSTLSQVEKLLKSPWSGKETPLALETNSFHFALLSANKARLVIREWLDVPLGKLRDNLAAYLDAIRIAGPRGIDPRPLPIPVVLGALKSEDGNRAFRSSKDLPTPRGLESGDGNLVRGLLRTAFAGLSPPACLAQAAIRRFRSPRCLADMETLFPLAAALKLCLTHGRKEAVTMEELDPSRTAPAYLCGRLMGVLEETQRRTMPSVKSTLIDRFYGAASLAPKLYLGLLLRHATTAYLPKLRKEGSHGLAVELERIMGQFASPDRLPATLSLKDQAEFALGFYHQRAWFRSQRDQRRRNDRSAGETK